ncbi:hypothetical protein [Sunxiuqinia rutila]|uniref:hypothetical protein n=1 Tax=Sunxiuqinia rutila TaxID=1397841 RepID=UPI003D361E8B
MEIIDFLIYPNTPDETETLNRLLYQDGQYIFTNKKEPKISVSKQKFIDAANNSKNKDSIIEYELKKIDDYIFTRKQTTIVDGEQYEKDRFFMAGYEDFLLHSKEFDWSERSYQTALLFEKLRGIEWAKYRKFVKDYSTSTAPKPTELKLTGEQKFLVLHYWKFGNEIKTNTKKALLYDFFISELKQSTIRPMFSDIPKYETEENLDAVVDFFRLLGLTSKAREIQDKVNKLRKKQ